MYVERTSDNVTLGGGGALVSFVAVPICEWRITQLRCLHNVCYGKLRG